MLICLGLTLASMLTPGWVKVDKTVVQSINNIEIPDQFGLFQFSCVFPGQNDGNNDCSEWFDVSDII